MPTYEYRCPAGHTFEKLFQTMSASRHAKCPTCGKRAERVISGGAGLVFKGSGFYITDYKRAGEKRGADGEPKPSGDAKPADAAKPTPPKPEK